MPTISLPTQSHEISLADAAEMTSRYRANIGTILKTEYSSADILPLSETFNKSVFENFINDTDCKGFRIYNGMDENLKVHAILVGVNEDNEDMLPTNLTNSSYLLFQDAQRCPPACPPDSELNEDQP